MLTIRLPLHPSFKDSFISQPCKPVLSCNHQVPACVKLFSKKWFHLNRRIRIVISFFYHFTGTPPTSEATIWWTSVPSTVWPTRWRLLKSQSSCIRSFYLKVFININYYLLCTAHSYIGKGKNSIGICLLFIYSFVRFFFLFKKKRENRFLRLRKWLHFLLLFMNYQIILRHRLFYLFFSSLQTMYLFIFFKFRLLV